MGSSVRDFELDLDIRAVFVFVASMWLGWFVSVCIASCGYVRVLAVDNQGLVLLAS